MSATWELDAVSTVSARYSRLGNRHDDRRDGRRDGRRTGDGRADGVVVRERRIGVGGERRALTVGTTGCEVWKVYKDFSSAINSARTEHF